MALKITDFNESFFFVFGKQKYIWEFVRGKLEKGCNTIGHIASRHGTREQCNVELIDGDIYFYSILVSTVVKSDKIDLSDYNKVTHISQL